ncbi:hypothetical protein DUI87_30777 [Hirundo rustica rustica]|uniref:Uncharacterized protein n=1 Tax=Hirundo rustica rustica TaxID=333673 RepID=A0A3M0J1M1_HIRRU|nr:hypothetical protein DUI87_30777 [Hirundo rustica rustica]
METVHTGLLGGLILVLIASGYANGACPIYDGEDQESLIRVHTNVNPTCFDVTRLSTCKEEGKQYWVAKNAATFKQRLTGECPIREWFCMEKVKVNGVKGVKDLIKEKPLNIKRMETDEHLSKNLFIDLVEKISHELNITNCWIGGSTQMLDVWPWEGISLTLLDILRWKKIQQKPPHIGKREKEQWDLKSKVIGEECIRRAGKQYKTFVGKMACKRSLTIRERAQKWIPRGPKTYWAVGKKETGCTYHEEYQLHQCTGKGINPFSGLREISKYWRHPFNPQNTSWKAPDHLFWICGDRAYTHLPGDWASSCTIGITKPAFFLLPKESGSGLGVPLYDHVDKKNRQKRTIINMDSTQTWKGTVWTPEEIIKTYGPPGLRMDHGGIELLFIC